MSVSILDPLSDQRWSNFLNSHPDASVFHSVGWLKTLQKTYGYEPVVYTTSKPGTDLTNGIVFCRITSWITGKRLVSLPFSDHCQPLIDNLNNYEELLDGICKEAEKEKLKYIELRPLTASDNETCPMKKLKYGISKPYLFFSIDLNRTLDEIYADFHRSSVQQSLRRSERANLTYEEGRSDEIIRKFYKLTMITRRKHFLPPQPLEWFLNMRDALGESFCVRASLNEGVPTAVKLRLTFKDKYYAKYQAADYNHTRLGGTQMLTWIQIKEAKEMGMSTYDLGRCEVDDEGLATSKIRWGAKAANFEYYRYPAPQIETIAGEKMNPIVSKLFAYIPDNMLTACGKFLYKHVG